MSVDVDAGLCYGICLTEEERDKIWEEIESTDTELIDLLENNLWAQTAYEESDWFIGKIVETDTYMEVTSLVADLDDETLQCIDYVEKFFNKKFPRKMYLISRWY